MGENNSKWSNWQTTNLKNIQAAYAAQFQKNKWPNQKMGQILTDISPKKIYRWLTNTWKDAQHHSLLEKCQSKPQWDITSHQSEWPSSKSLQTINAGNCVEKRECSWNVGGNVNWYSHYGRWYGDSLKKLGMKLSYDLANPLLGIYPEETRVKKTHVSHYSLHYPLQ